MNLPTSADCGLRALGLSILAATALIGCGGSDDAGAPAPAAPPAISSMSPADACTTLNGTAVAASAIALATTGAKVTATALQPASGTGPTAVGEYCRVQGVINPVDRTAPVISFQLNLPSTWNNKAFQLMGGGYDGSVITGTGGVPGSGGIGTPLARGYATFGSDSGHAGSAVEASFALNQEALENYLGDQLRKTRDVAMQLINTRYGSAPSRTYAGGGSGGGREALYVADRWPALYDGVISYYPAWSLTAMLTNYNRIAKALAAPGAWSNPTKQTLVFNAVTAACDALDGAADGLVGNVAACHFDPQTLRCAGGTDTGNTCLSDAQIAGFNAYATGLALPFALANGTNSYPAYNMFNGAANLTGAMGSLAPVTPSTTQMAFAHYIGESFVRYWITGDANDDSLQFDINSVGYFRQRAQYISSRQDITPDLSAFAAKGGKVLMLHGQADPIIPTASAEDYYNRIVASMGAPSVASFLKFYEVPGYGHGNGAFNVSWDSITALENWVEHGAVPVAQVARDANASQNNRTRPLCEYPTWPKYNGTADINAATSYACSP
jgi:feruloyl esterase